MFDRRTMNAMIFRDTEQRYESDETLKVVVDKSQRDQKLIFADEEVCYEEIPYRQGNVLVSGKRTLEASEFYAKQGKKVCVLNFASATNPGGGVVYGASAQEEAICRCSTLYPCLNTFEMWNDFYMPHREANDPLYNDDCIFTPNVKVFKSDIDFPELLPKQEWWDVDVITCAAPNLRERPSNRMNPNAGSKSAEITYNGLVELHTSRIEKIFQVAIANKAEVLILGAFGCGAFRNPPELVAEVFAEFTKKYRYYFDVIEFAVYHTGRETPNFVAFNDAMKGFA